MLHNRAFRFIFLLLALSPLSTLNAAFAQNDKPTPINVFNPPAWATLSLNSNQEPSCVFWTPSGGAPEYFCAAVIANIRNDADTSLCTPPPAGLGCAAFALRGVHVDPQTGNVSVGPPTIRRQSVALSVNPDVLTCIPFQDQFGTTKISCLLRNDSLTQATFVQSVVWDGTSWGVPSVILNGMAFNFVSNFSCVPWAASTAHPKNITCFALASFEGDSPAGSVRFLHWTWDGMAWTFPAPASGIQFGASPTVVPGNDTKISCDSPAPDQLACFLQSPTGGASVFKMTADGTSWTPSNGLMWSATPLQFGQLIAGVSTPPTCVTAQSASGSPARNDCFLGDNGVPIDPPFGFGWLYWVPDDNSRPFAVAMMESFGVTDPPRCIQWSANQIECFVLDKALDPSENMGSARPNATAWHILSYGLDRLTLEAEMLKPPADRSIGFWQESLGMPAPTNLEFAKRVVLGRTRVVPVDNSKTLTSFSCANGPKFQSLCVAGLVDSNFLSLSNLSSPDLSAFGMSRRLVFKLVGNPNGIPPQAPSHVVLKEPEPTRPLGR